MSRPSRRSVLQFGLAGLGAAAFGLARTNQAPPRTHPTMADVPFEPRDAVRVGFVGVGGRGTSLLAQFLAIDGVAVPAVCDIVSAHAERAAQRITDSGRPAPELYTRSETDFERLCARGDLDAVVIATPWDWHVPMAIRAMEGGAVAAVEVPAAVTLEECWQLVETSERTRRHCVMLENVCYGWSEMLVLNLVRAGVLGEIKHGEAAYIHDLRWLLLADEGEGLWRRAPHTVRNGNLYPTHGLGPVAQAMGIDRGDRFDYMVSMSSPERNLTEWRDTHMPADSPKRAETYVCGDMNTSLIKTVQGRTIMLQHDVVSPRPYDRINLVSGTKGCFRGFPDRIFLDGQEEHDWREPEAFRADYEHPLWTRVGELARNLGGHGGMDFIMAYRLVQCLREGLPPDMDVYDAASWSAPTPLSQDSVASGSQPVPFPDFTRGAWEGRAPLVI